MMGNMAVSRSWKLFIKPATIIVLGLFLVCVVLTLEHLRLVRTESRLAKSWLAISKTLDKENWEQGYSPLDAIQTMFPEIPTEEDAVIDGWGNPIHISILDTPDRFMITVTSPGKDHQLDTEDDRRKYGFLHKFEQQW